MAYIVDILKTVKSELDYKLTILGGGGIVIEGFKSIIYYSCEHVELRVNKARLILDGIGLYVKEAQRGLLILDGVISKCEVTKS